MKIKFTASLVIFTILNLNAGQVWDPSASTGSISSGISAFAGGQKAQATGNYAFAFGQPHNESGYDMFNTIASGTSSFAIGYGAQALSDYSFAFGRDVSTSGLYSFAMGQGSVNIMNSDYSFTFASGFSSFAFGQRVRAQGVHSFAFGKDLAGFTSHSFAFGFNSYSHAQYATVFGNNSNAIGMYSFAGGNTVASTGVSAFAYGENILAKGWGSISFGINNETDGEAAAAIGKYVKAVYDNTVVIGKVNSNEGFPLEANGQPDKDHPQRPLFVVGNGTTTTNPNNTVNLHPSNAFVIFNDGKIIMSRVQGDISMGIFGEQ